jgi:hypothetical protein
MAQFWRTASFQIFDGQEMILPKTGRVYQSKSETVSDFSALDHSDGHGIMRLERCGRKRSGMGWMRAGA